MQHPPERGGLTTPPKQGEKNTTPKDEGQAAVEPPWLDPVWCLLPPSIPVTLGPLTFATVVTAVSLAVTLETFVFPSPLGWGGTFACPAPVPLAPVAQHVLSDSTDFLLIVVVIISL